MRRAALIVLAVLFVAPIATAGLAPLAAAQDGTATPTPTNETATATPTPTPDPVEDRIAELADDHSSPYDYSWLSSPPSVAYPDRYPSMRPLPEPERAFVGARYQDPSLINVVFGGEPAYQELETGAVVRENRLQLYASTEGEYQLYIVSWQEQRTRVNDSDINRPIPYAANQSVENRTLTFAGDQLYQTENVSLEPHYNETWRVTMWLEDDDGDRVAKWRFRHRSNPQDQAVSIDSAAEAWGFAFRNAVGPGVAGVIVGLLGARLSLRRVGRGPGFGVGAWAIIIGLLALFTVPTAGFYYQVAVILQNLPWVMGLSIGVIAYAVGLTFHEPVRTIAFMRRELARAKTVAGANVAQKAADGGEADIRGPADLYDERTGALFADLPEVPVVRTGDTYRVPVEGIRPFFARLFAKAAEFDPTGIATRTIVKTGRIDDIITVDPGEEDAIVHKPARLVFALPWQSLQARYEDREADPSTGEVAVAGVLSSLILLGPPAAGWIAADAMANVGPVGLVAGLLVTAIYGYTAEDGWLEFVPAPEMYKSAEENLTTLQRAYSESKEQHDARQEKWQERATTVSEAREDQQNEERTITGELLGNNDVTDGDGG